MVSILKTIVLMGIPLGTKPFLNENHPAIGSSMVTASPADSG